MRYVQRECFRFRARFSDPDGDWRDAFLAAVAEALKVWQEDLVDAQGRRQKRVIAELAMENKLLCERIRRMEDEKPFLRWRSRK